MKIMDMICDEIEKIEQKGINNGNVDILYKLIDMKKDLVTIEGMEGYSEAGYGRDGYSRAYDSGNSYGHYVRGHYSRDDGYSRRDGGYSRADGKEGLMRKLEMIMQDGGMNHSEIERYMKKLEEA